MSWINAGKEGTRFELYSQMEKQYGIGHHRITIRRKTTGSSKCKGFCFYESHPGFLTDQDITVHHCCEKACRYFLHSAAPGGHGCGVRTATGRSQNGQLAVQTAT